MTNGLSAGAQRIRSVRTRGMLVPLKFTLGTSATIVKAVPLLLVDLLNEDGVTGRAYAFCYRPSGAVAISAHLFEAVDLLKGKDTTPFDVTQTLSRQFALLGVTGTVRMALSLLDMAMWDAIAQMQRIPLSSLLGSSPKPLRAYDSRGLGLKLTGDELSASEPKRPIFVGIRHESDENVAWCNTADSVQFLH